jgi:NAD(P)H-hydrate epimerase
VKADLVVTFHRAKKGLEDFNTIVKDIGIPKKAEEYVGIGDVIVNLPKREEESRKGDNGRVLIVGGSDLYYGAPILSGFGAMNSGADLVFLAVPELNFDVSRVFSPDLIVRKYEGEYLSYKGIDVVIELATDCDAVVIGPGLGQREETKKAVLEILEKVRKPVVIDADGIKAISGNIKVVKKLNALVTPHVGEFKMLIGGGLPKGLKNRKGILLEHARKLGSTILLNQMEG